MEPGITEPKSDSHSEPADVLLDLGDIEPAHASADDFVLDLEDAGVDEVAPAYAAPTPSYGATTSYEATPRYDAPMRTFVEPQVTEAPAPAYESSYQPMVQSPPAHSSFAETQEVLYASDVREIEPYEAPAAPKLTTSPIPVAEPSQPATSISADQLSPEMIDAIARRCVELMSDKVIREIAWEVVPDLAELLIKRQLEENQTK